MEPRYKAYDEFIDWWYKTFNEDTGRNLICFALENAFVNGNKNNPELPVIVRWYAGQEGMVISIKDAGKGFDYERITAKVERIRRRDATFDDHKEKLTCKDKYFLKGGGGFALYVTHPAELSFADKGATIHLCYSAHNKALCPRGK